MIEDLFVFIRANPKLRDFVHFLGWTIGSLVLRTLWIFPINKDKFLFSHFNGKGYGDNPKYICEEIHRRKPDADLVWLVVSNDVHLEYFPDYVRTVRKYSIQAIYEFATSSVWINDSRMDDHVRKRRGQYYVQTWHGGFALKRLETDFSSSPKWSVMCAKNDSKMADIFVSNSKILSSVYRSAFWYEGPIFEVGYPRNDILVLRDTLQSANQFVYSKLHHEIHIPKHKKILMYAPTFRKEYMCINSIPDVRAWLTSLNSKYGDEWVLLLRMHPNLVGGANILDICDNISIFDVSIYPDMQELLAVADILVTDYSSCMFDFGLTQRPCFLYVPDVETYISDDRGFYIQLSELPFPQYKTNDEFLRGIADFDLSRYQKDLDSFYKKYGSFENGEAAKKTVDWIFDHLN